jgi:hypothetical protein
LRQQIEETRKQQIEEEASDEYINREICLNTQERDCKNKVGCQLLENVCYPDPMNFKNEATKDKYIQEYLAKPNCVKELRKLKTDRLLDLCKDGFTNEKGYRKVNHCNDEENLDYACRKNLIKIAGTKKGEAKAPFQKMIKKFSAKQDARNKSNLGNSKYLKRCETAIEDTQNFEAICENGTKTGNYFANPYRQKYRPYCMQNERVKQLCEIRNKKNQAIKAQREKKLDMKKKEGEEKITDKTFKCSKALRKLKEDFGDNEILETQTNVITDNGKPCEELLDDNYDVFVQMLEKVNQGGDPEELENPQLYGAWKKLQKP